MINLILNREEEVDFSKFVLGNEEFNRRTFEHILKKRAPDDFVFSPTLFVIPLIFLALGSQNGINEISKELLDATSLPCDFKHLQQHLKILLNQVC